MIFFLEHLSKLTFAIIALVVCTIVLDMVDEEQTQHLNPFGEQLAFTLKMCLDGLTYLYPAHRVFRNLTLRISLIECHAVEEFQAACPSVDTLHHVIVTILCHLSALRI